MAPRSKGALHDRQGRGDSRILSANTGAGVNARHSVAAGARHGIHARNGRCTRAQAPGRAGVPRSQNGHVARPQGSLGQGSQNVSHGLEGSAARMTTDVVNNEASTEPDYRPTFALSIRPKSNSSPTRQPTLFSGSKLTRIYPESQRRLDPISPIGRESSFTLSPTPIRMLNLAKNLVAEDNAQGSPSPSPSPPKSPVYRGKDAIKKAVSNHRLRAIFADRPYPTPRRKSGEERPILRMGIYKEYK